MALLDVASWRAATGNTSPSDVAVSIAIDVISSAAETLCGRTFASASYTSILDAPATDQIVLPQRPVQLAGLAVYFNPSARGDPSAFTSDDHLLTLYSDYLLEVDADDASQSSSGILRCLTGQWGSYYYRPVNSLAAGVRATPRAVKVSYTAGYTTTPAALKRCLIPAVSQWIKMVPDGVLSSSEGWNGYSVSRDAQQLANGILLGPMVWPVLRKYVLHDKFIG